MSGKVTREKIVDKETGEVKFRTTYETQWVKAPGFKTPYNHDRNHESRSSGLHTDEPTKTQQHLAAETDINNILKKFMTTGELPIGAKTPSYMDVEKEFDLQDNMVTGAQVDAAWNALSPEVRNTLKNPETFASYVEHCLEVGDIEPLRALGLAKPAPTPTPATPVAGTPTTPAGGAPAPASVATPGAPAPGST